MTVAMTAKIVFPARGDRPELTIRQPSNVTLESSWRQLTGIATVVLPRNVSYFDRENVKEVFRRGDSVEIYLGYDENMILEFVGYVKETSAAIPIEIKCQDEMFKIKSVPVNFSSPDITLQGLMDKILPGVEKDVLEGVELGAVRFSRTTVGEVLEKLQTQMKLYSYIAPGTKKLVCGKIYADDSDTPASIFDLERNVVENRLEYRNREDILVKVRGTAMGGGKKLEYEFGDNDPDKNIEWQFNVKTQSALEAEVKRFYEANKKDGFSGSFTAFGIPSVQHGRRADISSTLYPDRNGVYYIDGVTKTFDTGGYRQEINLGNRYERRE